MYVQRNTEHVRVTTVAMEKDYTLLTLRLQPYLSSMKRARAVLYFHMWPIRLHYIFPRHGFRKNVSDHKRVF